MGAVKIATATARNHAIFVPSTRGPKLVVNSHVFVFCAIGPDIVQRCFWHGILLGCGSGKGL